MFPVKDRAEAKTLLAESVQAILSQMLCHSVEGGRAICREVLLRAEGVPTAIRENNIAALRQIMDSYRQQGMRTLDFSLRELLATSKITASEAYARRRTSVNSSIFLSAIDFCLRLLYNKLMGTLLLRISAATGEIIYISHITGGLAQMNEKSAIRIFSIIIFISAVMILTATVLFIVHERKAYYLKVDGMDKSAASVTAAPAAVESKIPEKKEEEKLETAPFPDAHAELYNVVQEEVPDIYQSIANDIECSSLFKTLDNRLSKCITDNVLTVHVKAQHQQQYGTVVKVEKYGKDGKNFATDKTILLLNENIPDGESADLTIYPTAMITQDNNQTLEIFALNPLAAIKRAWRG